METLFFLRPDEMNGRKYIYCINHAMPIIAALLRDPALEDRVN